MKFRYLAGVGRSGSHWLKEFFQFVSGPNVIAMHEGFAQRTLKAGSATLGEWFARYVSRITTVWPGRRTYIECEGTLLDRGAMHYGLPTARETVDAMRLDDMRGVLLVRHPFGYVASVKASGWLGGWWKRPDAGRLTDVNGFDDWPIVEQAAISWQTRNAWFYDLVGHGARSLHYESILGNDVDEPIYVDLLGGLLDWFDIESVQPCTEWAQLRSQRVQVKNKKRVELNDGEKAVVRAICAPMMEKLGYE